MKLKIMFGVLAISTLSSLFAVESGNGTASLEVDPAMVTPFFMDTEREHTYKIVDSQVVEDGRVGAEQYSVSWYVDTNEWDFDPAQNYIFSKISFQKGGKEVASFCNDDGWSFLSKDNAKVRLFKTFKMGASRTALVFRGGAYFSGASELTIFLLDDNGVHLLFNQEYYIQSFSKDKINVKKDPTGVDMDYFSFSDGLILLFTSDYPSGKVIL